MSFTHIIFRTLYTLVSRPSCSTGKVAAQHRKTPYRAAQRFSAWVHASEKSRSLYFSCCLSGQMHGIRLRSAAQGADFRSYPFARVSRFATPFCTTPFQGVRQSYALKAGVGNHDPIQNAVACKSEQSKNFAAIRHNAHKPRRAALHFLWFFSERAGRTAQRAAQGFSEKANLGLGIFIYRVPFRYRLRPQNLL